jgi:hypothetical protein
MIRQIFLLDNIPAGQYSGSKIFLSNSLEAKGITGKLVAGKLVAGKLVAGM